MVSRCGIGDVQFIIAHVHSDVREQRRRQVKLAGVRQHAQHGVTRLCAFAHLERAGATFAGALEVCKGAKAGDTVLCMLPDTGERYLSTPLFNDIGVDMSDNELNIANSTPNYRLPPKAA